MDFGGQIHLPTQVQPLVHPVGLLCSRVSILLVAGGAGTVEAGSIALL